MVSGLAFAAATTSAKVLNGREGCVLTMFGAVPISSTGSRSFSVSNGRLCRNGFTAWVSNTITQLLPSGSDLATWAVPMLPDAPGLFSMTMVAPSRCCNPGCTMRAIGSAVPPGGNGTVNLMTPGKAAWSWARLRPTNGVAITPSTIERLVSECKVVLPVNKLRPSQSLIRSGPDCRSKYHRRGGENHRGGAAHGAGPWR